jgi:hypothetical protein
LATGLVHVSGQKASEDKCFFSRICDPGSSLLPREPVHESSIGKLFADSRCDNFKGCFREEHLGRTGFAIDFGTRGLPNSHSTVKAFETRSFTKRRQAMNRMIGLVSRQDEQQEYWQAKVEQLEKYVCELLLKNQTLRMELLAERGEPQDEGDFGDLLLNSLVG